MGDFGAVPDDDTVGLLVDPNDLSFCQEQLLDLVFVRGDKEHGLGIGLKLPSLDSQVGNAVESIAAAVPKDVCEDFLLAEELGNAFSSLFMEDIDFVVKDLSVGLLGQIGYEGDDTLAGILLTLLLDWI